MITQTLQRKTTNHGTDHGDNWRSNGTCVTGWHDQDHWFPANDDPDPIINPVSWADVQVAKRICHSCPVLDTCRADALANASTHGVQAGMTPAERRQQRRREVKA